MNKQGKTEGLN